MSQKIKTKSIKSIVRLPKQDRSRITVEAILESAFQILETDGLEGFKVVALAERSGYSVGCALIVSSFAVGLALGAARKTHEELYPCTASNATA